MSKNEKRDLSKKAFTIKDVAKICGVSIATVSRVINGTGRFSEETRDRVMETIREINFIPSSAARSMITKKHKLLAVVVPDIINPFYASVIQGAIATAKSMDYNVTVLITGDDRQQEEELFDCYLDKNVDGILIIGAHDKPEFYRQVHKPLVLVDRYVENTGRDGVVIDNFRGSYELVKRFIEHGHTKIAMVNGLLEYNDGLDRYWGYKTALQTYHIEENENYYLDGSWFVQHGYDSAKKLMSLKEVPTAILAGNNLICEGVLYALRDLGLGIGTDISLAGFDESILAEYSRPQVTVVRRPTSEMGIEGIKLLLNIVEGNHSESGNKKIVLPVEILDRDSIANIK